jgi:HD-like signal output (HDOD) protein
MTQTGGTPDPLGQERLADENDSAEEATTRRVARRRIGQLLLDGGIVSSQQFDEALGVQSEHGGEVLDILFARGGLDPTTFLDFLLTCPSIMPNELSLFEIPADVVGLLPAPLAHKHSVVPLQQADDALTLGVMSVLSLEVQQELETALGVPVVSLKCRPEDIRAAIRRYYGESEDGARPASPSDSSTDFKGLEVPLRLSRVTHLIAGLSSLPALPETVDHVREALNDPNKSIATVADVITLDPPVAAKVLSVANSAAYGFSQQIHDITLAVSLLGLRETYAVVLSAAIVDLVRRWKNFDYRTFWLDAMCCAVASRIVAKASGRRDLAGIFSAGLLHDFGRAALWEVAPDLCREIDADLVGAELVAEEEEVIGLSHAEAGYQLACHWGLPAEIAEPIRFHHEPEQAISAKESVAVVALADAITKATGSDLAENMAVFEGKADILASLGLDAEMAEAMLAEYLDRRESALREALD